MWTCGTEGTVFGMLPGSKLPEELVKIPLVKITEELKEFSILLLQPAGMGPGQV